MNGRTGLVIAVLAAFFFGCTAGALAGFGAAMFSRGPGPRFHGPPPPGRFERGPIGRDLEQELELTPQQAERFHDVLERSRSKYAAVRESTRAELESVLTPAQRERYRTLETRYFVRRHGRWRGGPDPHRFPLPEPPKGENR